MQTRTRVVLVVHQLELRKPTNTGVLALSCLPNSELAVRGRAPRGSQELGIAEPPAWLTGAVRPVLLFPHEDARPLVEWATGDAVTLVVPDGTWSQASRTRRRVPGLDLLPCAALPVRPEDQEVARMRHDPRPGRVSTIEALAAALGILEGPAVEESLRRIHRQVSERALWAAGRLAADRVRDGLPAGAHAAGRVPSPSAEVDHEDS